MVLVVPTNYGSTSIGGIGVGADWRSTLIATGISIAETVITNYLNKKINTVSEKAKTVVRKNVGKAFGYPHKRYRTRNFNSYRSTNKRYRTRSKKRSW